MNFLEWCIVTLNDEYSRTLDLQINVYVPKVATVEHNVCLGGRRNNVCMFAK